MSLALSNIHVPSPDQYLEQHDIIKCKNKVVMKYRYITKTEYNHWFNLNGIRSVLNQLSLEAFNGSVYFSVSRACTLNIEHLAIKENIIPICLLLASIYAEAFWDWLILNLQWWHFLDILENWNWYMCLMFFEMEWNICLITGILQHWDGATSFRKKMYQS